MDTQAIREFVAAELIPLEPILLQRGFLAVLPYVREKRAEVRRRGWWTPHLPPQWGGSGLALAEFAAVSEELGRTPLGHYTFNCAAPDIGNMELLLAHGNDAQRERWLRPLAAGEIRSCFAMTEPEHAGSNPVWLSATAVRDSHGYVINGHKWFATGADGAAFAVTMATTQPDAQPHRRASQIIVPADAPGFRLVRNIRIMGEDGEDWLSHGEILFDHCRVPLENLIGQEGDGFALAQERLGPGRIHHCMRWIGICERAFDMMCRRSVARDMEPGKPLATKQAVQHWIAECRAAIDAARMLTLDAARKIDAAGARSARVEISTIKFYVADVLRMTLDRALQVHGALGMTDDTVLSFWYRHERAARIYDGPDETHKTAVARHILRGYGVDIARL